MLAPPPDFDIVTLARELEGGWGIPNPGLEYLAAGFGSHHWRATSDAGGRWFLTVDEHSAMSSITELGSAFGTAAILGRDPGLPFVLAPLPATGGEIVRIIAGGRFTLAVTPWIDAVPLGDGPFENDRQRSAVLRMLGDLHAATNGVDVARIARDDLAIRRRNELETAIGAIGHAWQGGPFAERTRLLLRPDLPRLEAAFARYDALVDAVMSDPVAWVVTHGEPHTANVLVDASGGFHLIDWDTVRLGPRERDLCAVVMPSTEMGAYRAVAGDVPISANAMRMYRMQWDLNEIAEYVSQFRQPHEDDANTRESWNNLNQYLPVAEDHLDPVAR